ncbi:unnamed protein product [Paramecium octaurelia]|uniref:Uncharacterized protein n=1 Tax=Paramecium octaurelia TaxID=43137 RepID=A0A8S1YIH9_PAROT|nr:unnamed protein product [Paramecium octaurelia]
MTNLEQINYLYWKGCYGNNIQRVGYWMATWDGEALINDGGHYKDDGRKEGNWVEIVSTFCNLCIIFEYQILQLKFMKQESMRMAQEREDGSMSIKIKSQEVMSIVSKGKRKDYGKNYKKDFRIVPRFFIMGSTGVVRNLVDGIQLDQPYQQQARVDIEVSDEFNVNSQITYNGEYKNGKKVGSWDIMHREHSNYTFKFVGGGSYDELGEGIKIGKWIELFMIFIIIAKSHTGGSIKMEKKLVVGIFCLGMILFIHFNQSEVNHIIQYVRDLNLVNELNCQRDLMIILKQYILVNKWQKSWQMGCCVQRAFKQSI